MPLGFTTGPGGLEQRRTGMQVGGRPAGPSRYVLSREMRQPGAELPTRAAGILDLPTGGQVDLPRRPVGAPTPPPAAAPPTQEVPDLLGGTQTIPEAPFPGATFAGSNADQSTVFWYDPATDRIRNFTNGQEVTSTPARTGSQPAPAPAAVLPTPPPAPAAAPAESSGPMVLTDSQGRQYLYDPSTGQTLSYAAPAPAPTASAPAPAASQPAPTSPTATQQPAPTTQAAPPPPPYRAPAPAPAPVYQQPGPTAGGGNTALIFDAGGVIDEPVIGKGQITGRTHVFAANGRRELVTPLRGGSNRGRAPDPAAIPDAPLFRGRGGY